MAAHAAPLPSSSSSTITTAAAWQRARHLPVWLLGILLAVLMGMVGALLEVTRQRPVAPPPVLMVAPITKGAVVGSIRAAGTVRPVQQTLVTQALGARLLDVAVSPGDVVRHGQLLAHVDPLAARATLADAESRAVAAETASLEAELMLARLMRAGGTAESDTPSSGGDDKLVVAQARLARAAAALRARDSELRVAEARLKQAVLRAPVDGVVIAQHAEAGATLAPGAAVFTLAAELERLQVIAYVSEAELGRVRLGQRARFTVPSAPGRQFMGEVQRIGAIEARAAEPARVAVAIAVRNAANELKPGMTAAVQIEAGSGPGGFRVPVAALQFSPSGGGNLDGEPALWLMGAQEGSLRRVAVEVRNSDGAFVEVSAPELREGAGVVVGYATTRGR
jgi:HlyD family secretion protein